ncbi:methyl-accepting chemotaxis protein [Psychrobacillus sp. BL-248-WT-3]|uniref:methyl-accepting chemotaxis protein n=1 Tax=Psychrobacillus sp. BL-248-WT-3 TaxID=2725306 RepID=UPI00146E5AD4|nr:methyl-accepting chemotaxis protein [Psychrobacillus sp. BL-248-WT-3]NME05078.1 HAMP domain-containing protein [Psychrobacillus sp. BL-248-WT-3]
MKWTITKKMWLGFSAIILLMVVVSYFSSLASKETNSKYKEILEVDSVNVSLIQDIKMTQNETTENLYDYLLTKTDASRKAVRTNLESNKKLMDELKLGLKSEDTLPFIEDYERKYVMFTEANEKLISNQVLIDPSQINTLTKDVKTVNDNMISILDKIEEQVQKDMANTVDELHDFERAANLFIMGITIAGAILGAVIAFYIGRSIARPIKRVTSGLTEIAGGNLLVEPILIKNKDEAGEMASAFNKMSADLRMIVSNVQETSMQLAANAEELSASSEESLASSQMVASSAHEQMASSEQQVLHMTTSMEGMSELSQGVNEIASSNGEMLNSANNVGKLVKQGSDVIEAVAQQMSTIHETFNETATNMRDMEKHSSDIQGITTLITQISEQTNLLALNAAIEAARAGEYGKGFAVVADEVRKLAEQSKNAASEIADMVKVIQGATENAVGAITAGEGKVKEGLAKTKESLDVFEHIETAVVEVGFKVESVSSAIKQIQTIAQTVTEGSRDVQRLAEIVAQGATDTSAATEQQLASNSEITSNAQSLANLAEKLQDNISHFKM